MPCLFSEISSKKECGSVHKSELIDLSKYRLEKAHDMLKAALRTMEIMLLPTIERITASSMR